MFYMNKYAVIQLGGRQYSIHEGDTVESVGIIGKQSVPVLFYFDGEKNHIGNPVLKDIEVKLELIGHKLSRKIMVSRFKSKSRYRKKRGSREHLNSYKVIKIHNLNDKKDIKGKEEISKDTVKNDKSIEVKTKKLPVKSKIQKTAKKSTKLSKKEKK